MIWMCGTLFSTEKYIVKDSIFFVANGIFALAVKGVYAGGLVKKNWYWPKSDPRDLIDRYFSN